jgi:hypothetical protein
MGKATDPKKKVESRIVLTEDSSSSRQMSRKVSGTQVVGGLSEKDKLRMMEEKT